MNLSKYQFKDYIKDFMDDINNHDDEISSFSFSYNGEEYIVDHIEDGKFVVYKNIEGSEEFCYSSMDDFFLNFKLNGKPFIEEVNNLDYEEY